MKFFYEVTGMDGRPALIPVDNVAIIDMPSKRRRQEQPSCGCLLILKSPSVEAPIKEDYDQVRAVLSATKWDSPVIKLSEVPVRLQLAGLLEPKTKPVQMYCCRMCDQETCTRTVIDDVYDDVSYKCTDKSCGYSWSVDGSDG